MNGFSKKTLLIPGSYVIKKFEKERIGNLDFYISFNTYNYDTPPPAFRHKELVLYNDLGVFPQLKDPVDIRKGFYMKTLDPEEKEKLRKIIEIYFSGY
jgi:hypothetical protein